ncbi:spermidine/putrescine-binding protein [Bradyrhizobium sp. RT6a]|uniref:hypothetical protein n=1 Tax=Bradyrhizobium sp. RT6a TaxID=3156381 RepID=UPI003397D66F
MVSLAAIGLAAGTLETKVAFAGDQLTVTASGGSTQAAYRKVLFDPFTNVAGIKIKEDEYSGEIGKVRAMVESKSVIWECVLRPWVVRLDNV